MPNGRAKETLWKHLDHFRAEVYQTIGFGAETR